MEGRDAFTPVEFRTARGSCRTARGKAECAPFRTTGMCTRPPKPRAGEAAHRFACVIDDRCARPIGMSSYPAISIGEQSPRPRTTDQHHPLDHTRKYQRVWDAIVAVLCVLNGNRAGDSVTWTRRESARRIRVDARAVNDLLAEMDQQMPGRLDRMDRRSTRLATVDRPFADHR